ncbi:MAG: addiction module antitoxin [Tepidiformaceae bacterium]
MQKKLTLTLDEAVYDGLHRVVGRGRISEFVATLVRPFVLDAELEEGYRLAALDDESEAEALEWANALIGDALDEER